MSFNLKKILKRANAYANVQVQPQPVVPVEEKKEEENIEYVNPMLENEPKQETYIPVYEQDEDEDFAPIAKKRRTNDKIERKVSLNPLSDS